MLRCTQGPTPAPVLTMTFWPLCLGFSFPGNFLTTEPQGLLLPLSPVLLRAGR